MASMDPRLAQLADLLSPGQTLAIERDEDGDVAVVVWGPTTTRECSTKCTPDPKVERSTALLDAMCVAVAAHHEIDP